VVAIASAMDEAREDVRANAVVPDSGVVWWRAQIRARREAADAAGRPITAAQAIAFACMVGVLGALIGATSTSLQKWLQAWSQSVIASVNFGALMHSLVTAAGEHQAIVLAIVGIICVVPTAVYLVLRSD
jgi:hypothetical protein